MRRIHQNGVVFYRFEGLAEESGLEHALFTRQGGGSRPPFASLNVGRTVGDDLEAVQANQQRALAALGWQREDVATCYQVHGVSVGVVGWDDRGQIRPATDALVTATPGVMLMLRFADCVPLMFYDPRQRVIGLAHAGWRGVAVGLVQATVKRLVEAFGCRPADLRAGVGPSIGPCCYQVGHEVVESVRAAVHGSSPFSWVDDRVHLNLWAAVTSQLAEAGVEQIEVAGLCTACHTDEWFSHRGEKGKTGRFGVVIALKGQTEGA